jgi:hypothetical protein
MKTLLIIGIILILFLFHNPQQLFAQPPSFDNDTSDVPIDGGLSILLAFGIGYGIKKNIDHQVHDKKNKPAPKD